jgi:hypothetical protein
MFKIAQNKPSDTLLISKHPMAQQLFTQVVSKLGINIPREIGPINQIYVGSGKNSDVVGFTSSDPNKIYIDIDNFGAKVSGLNLSPNDVLDFFSPIQNKENATDEIIKKINALKYIIEFVSIPIHERGHNPVGSSEDTLKNEGTAQNVERNAEKRMDNEGLTFIKDLIDENKAEGAKPAFDSIAGDYQSSIMQYRTAMRKTDIIKVSKLSNNIKDKKYSVALYNLALKYDKKLKN